MVSRGYARFLVAPLGALLMLVALSAGAVMAEDTTTCAVDVEPQAAAAGSAFVFTGTGFKPTTLALQEEDGDPAVHDLDVGDADPWEVTVRSRAGDEGIWTATFSADAECSASAEFRVTLSNTDLVSDLVNPSPQQPTAWLYLLVVVIGFSGGVLVARRIGDRGRA